jgi:ABC-type branched-subunit amino acid transport system ATPase component
MVQGKIISQGKPSEVINEPKVLEAYLGEGII